MAEKIIPDIAFFGQEIIKENEADFSEQCTKITDRLINFPPEKISELHLQDWYTEYWKLAYIFQYLNAPPEQVENMCAQIKQFADAYKNPIQQQYFALAFLLFGDTENFQACANQNLWSKNLREDFEKFNSFNKLTSLSANLQTRANVRRNLYIKNFLQEKYSALIKKYSAVSIKNTNCPKVAPKDFKIWYCWFQGEENLIPLARVCYESLKKNAGSYKICFIDENNFSDYVTIPEYVTEKFKGGGITRTHFSDIIRVNLLEKYGGLWLDATVLVTKPLENYKRFLKMDYFTQRFYKEKDNFGMCAVFASYGRWSGFIQGTAILHNPLFIFMKDFYNQYWQEYDEVIDYLLMDFLFDIAYDNIPFVKKEMDELPVNNIFVLDLFERLNLPYKDFQYDKLFKDNFLCKLGYKIPLDLQKKDSVFREIQKRYAPNTIGQF